MAAAAGACGAGDLDLRALLSSISGAADLEPSTPLSTPDLRLLSSHLSHHSSLLRSRALSFLLNNRHSLFSSLSAAADAASLSSALADSVSALNSSLDTGLDDEIRRIVDEIVSTRRELAERREQLEAVKAVSAVVEKINIVRTEIRSGRVQEAAVAVEELRKELFVDGKTGGDEPAVVGLLRKEWEKMFDEVQNLLTKCLEECIRFQEGKVEVVGRSNDSSVVGLELRAIFESLEIIGVLEYGMAKLADLMTRHVISHAICNRPTIISIEVRNQDEGPKAILKCVHGERSQEDDDGSVLYASLQQIVNFILKYICLENHDWISSFGKLTWAQISEMIITHFLSKAVPDVASKLIDFQDVMRATADFEISLSKMSFISADEKDGKLTKFVNDVELHFAGRKRKEFLVNARKLLVPYEYADPLGLDAASTEYVVELLFQPERCFISRSAFQLMKLVNQVLEDACVSSVRVAKEFYKSSRDALLMYKAIVPVQLEKQLDQISQVAAIVHNDFYYLAQEILGLAYEYRADFPSDLQKTAVFIDLAPGFYQVADGILQRQIQLAKSTLSEALNGSNGFQNTHLPQQNKSARFSIEQVVFNLEKIRIMWESILPQSVYRRSISLVLEFVFSRITKDILSIRDMAAEETYQLQLLIQLALDNLSALFLSLVAKDDEGKILDNNSWVQLEEALPTLQKLRKLAELLDLPLKSITEAWEAGELVRCGFSLNEVGSLIKAIFTDSALRKECLSRIGNSVSP